MMGGRGVKMDQTDHRRRVSCLRQELWAHDSAMDYSTTADVRLHSDSMYLTEQVPHTCKSVLTARTCFTREAEVD